MVKNHWFSPNAKRNQSKARQMAAIMPARHYSHRESIRANHNSWRPIYSYRPRRQQIRAYRIRPHRKRTRQLHYTARKKSEIHLHTRRRHNIMRMTRKALSATSSARRKINTSNTKHFAPWAKQVGASPPQVMTNTPADDKTPYLGEMNAREFTPC